MNKLDILKAARKLITDPKNWTKGTSARNKYGRIVTPWSEEAVCWCSMGGQLQRLTVIVITEN